MAGMTLVEVMVAMALTVVGIAAVYAGISQGQRMNYLTAQRVAAFGLCRDTLEQIRGMDYESVTTNAYSSQTVQITHLGGSRRIPLMATRTCDIASYSSPPRKAVTVMISWEYRGRTNSECARAVLFFRDSRPEATTVGGSIGGQLAINPNNNADHEFKLTLADGTEITRDTLADHNYLGYSGAASAIHLRCKGNSSQNTLSYNGQPYTFQNNLTYDIVGSPMTVNLFNDNINGAGKSMGKWFIQVTTSDGTITFY